METLAEIYESSASAIHDLQSQLAEAKVEITTLRKELGWYGDEGNWKRDYAWGTARISSMEADNGQRARDTLGGRDG